MSLQKDNVVGGDQAGRDLIKSTMELHFPKESYLRKCSERFKEEKKNDIQFNRILEKLQEYCSSIDVEGTYPVGLETKLTDGGFCSFYGFANRTKELFYKKLVKYQLYEAAQEIFHYVLADVYTRYHNLVYPLIQANAHKKDVLEAIHTQIIRPIQEDLEENVLELFADEINGAIYYLTGNCYIKWK